MSRTKSNKAIGISPKKLKSDQRAAAQNDQLRMKPLLIVGVYRFIALPNSKQQLQPAFILVRCSFLRARRFRLSGKDEEMRGG
jgi:hypothetical protein